MAYGKDMAGAARRHLRAADTLAAATSAGAQPGCRAVAGYLYGLCGELAVKQMMLQSGMTATANRGNDPFYAHFPNLKHQLRDSAQGRRQGELLTIAEDAALFRNWDVAMRYAPAGDIPDGLVTSWKASAEALVQRMDYE